MRLFPVTARRRLAVVCTAGALGVGALASPFAHADTKHHLKQQQSQAQHSVKSAQVDLDEASKQSRSAYVALTRSRADLRAARHDLQVSRAHAQAARVRFEKIQHQLVRARASLGRAESNLAQGQQAVTDQRSRLVHTVTSFYEEGDPQLVGFLSLLHSVSPADLTAKSANNDLVLSSQDQALDGLKASEVLLMVQTRELARARDEVAAKTAQAHADLLLKRRYQSEAAAAEGRVLQTVKDRKHAVALARQARAHDRAILARSKARAAQVHKMLMAEIAREIARAQRRARQRAQQRAQQGGQQEGQVGGYRGTTSGILMRPVNGPITSAYGYRINPVMHYYGLHDGDDFGAACGTPIWAAGDATVFSEYYSSVWGNRLFLNLGLVNGKNVTVIYNHLSAYRTSVGQHVSRGQVVGLIGTTGWSTGCHTHMTVMVNGVAVNPAPWIS